MPIHILKNMKNNPKNLFTSSLLLLSLFTSQPIQAQFNVYQGYHTTGRGNQRCVLLHIELADSIGDASIRELEVILKGETRRNIKNMELYQTKQFEFYADTAPLRLSCLKPNADTLQIQLPNGTSTKHLWVTADINKKARLGASVDAEVTRLKWAETITSERLHQTKFNDGNGNPDGEIHIYAVQSLACIPTTDQCRFYRIPAMTLDSKGQLVIAYDRRYDSNLDLGDHRIDVAVRKSSDGGRTWSQQHIIAQGDASSDGQYGFGDPSLVRTENGRLVCLMAAGKKGYFSSMRHIGICTSDDNGMTWTAPRELTTRGFTDATHNTTDSLGFWSIFATSGKGLLTRDGTILFTTNTLMGVPQGVWEGSSGCYILSSKDEGESWTLGPALAYDHCDESKIIQLPDDSLLLSVRQRGARGFNKADATAIHWQKQWRNEDINNGNPCNADIIRHPSLGVLFHTYLKHPTNRAHLVLSMSMDDGKTWQDVTTIQTGAAAYSTMEVLNDGSLAILFEDGSHSELNGYTLTYVTLTKSQLRQFVRQRRY